MQKGEPLKNYNSKCFTPNYPPSQKYQYQSYSSDDYESSDGYQSYEPSSYSKSPNSVTRNGRRSGNSSYEEDNNATYQHHNQVSAFQIRKPQIYQKELRTKYKNIEPKYLIESQKTHWNVYEDQKYEGQSPDFKGNLKQKHHRSRQQRSPLDNNGTSTPVDVIKSRHSMDYPHEALGHVSQIEEIMSLENTNLKQQNNYLRKMIKKFQKNECKYKQIIQKEKLQNQELLSQNADLKEKYQEAKKFVATNINKIEKIIEFQGVNNHLSDTSTSFHHSSMQITPFVQPQNQESNTLDFESKGLEDITHKNTMQQLNDRFDALMFEYKKTNDPVARKQCIQIAKSLKNQRKLMNSKK